MEGSFLVAIANRVILLAAMLMAVTVISARQDDVTVLTNYGAVRGMDTPYGQVFYDIPYAAPPVGSLRWSPPVPPKVWFPDVRSATEAAPGCPQYECQKLSPPEVCPNKTSEDCLYLNVWRPAATNVSSFLAVLVYLHGGNFVHMSGSSLLFDGRFLAQRDDVIVVTINYRLGALGFLVTGLGTEDAVGNYGLLDQLLALQWVQSNIVNFGGDPHRVTLFGQSAGAQSAVVLMGLEAADPYYNNVIIESSPLAIPYKRFGEAILLGAIFAEYLNCTPRDIDCMRSRSPSDIAYAQYLSRSKISSPKLLEAFEPWGPWVDGRLVPEEPVAAFQAGRASRKPLIIGTTSEETVLYIFSAWGKPVDELVYLEVLAATYPAHVGRLLTRYPPTNSTDERDTMSALSTDLVFVCSTRNATRSLVGGYAHTAVWHYVWLHAFSFKGWGNTAPFCQGRVCHGSEVPFVFHSAPLGGFTYTPDEELLSRDVMDYWANFAKYGDPNGQGQASWPRYSPDTNWTSLSFNVPRSQLVTSYKAEYCDFWDGIGYAA